MACGSCGDKSPQQVIRAAQYAPRPAAPPRTVQPGPVQPKRPQSVLSEHGSATKLAPHAPVWAEVYSGPGRPRPPGLDREIVISRYREDLSWLDLAPDTHLTIYNKGPLDFLPPVKAHTLINLENQGREAGTMLHHIVRHYDDLADVTLFVQADGPIHQEDILRRMAVQWPAGCASCLSTRYLPDSPDQWIKDRDRVEWVPTALRVGSQVIASEFEVRYGDARIQAHPHHKAWFDERAWHYVFTDPIPEQLWFCYAAMWAVPREIIHLRSIDFYRWLLSHLARGEHGSYTHTDPPINPWSLEALYKYIWDKLFNTRVK